MCLKAQLIALPFQVLVSAVTTGRLLATVKPDPDWPGMWRVHMPDGHVSDMVNLSRAKDAASTLALVALNLPERQRQSKGTKASAAA
jgi:hypothetical protein